MTSKNSFNLDIVYKISITTPTPISYTLCNMINVLVAIQGNSSFLFPNRCSFDISVSLPTELILEKLLLLGHQPFRHIACLIFHYFQQNLSQKKYFLQISTLQP